MNKTVLLSGAAAAALAFAAAYFLTSGSETPTATTSATVTATTTASYDADISDHAEKTGISWYDGSVDEAFALAKAEGKPVLLYWGAVWCPPCVQLKATIFKERDFIEKTDLFVPVYLDGDTERAQSYGEKFTVRGYPTLIIFNPEAEEVTRIPGGMNLERYSDVLDLALNNIQPAKTLLASILDDGYAPTEQELSLLAHYSWGQDAGLALGERDPADVFDKLSDVTPSELIEIKSRFEAEYMDTFSAEMTEEDKPIAEEVKDDIYGRLVELLEDHDNSRANLYFVPYSVGGIIENITEDGSENRETIKNIWFERLAALHGDTSLNKAERMRLFAGEIRFAKLGDGEVTEDLKSRIRDSISEERASAKDAYESIIVTNASFGLLLDTNQNELAGEILTKELETSDTGYYWMVDLAHLAEEAGQTDEAVKWLRLAYEDADGFATRAQWGSYYVNGLTGMKGDDIALVEKTVSTIFDEMEAQTDYMHARNKGAFKRIGRSLNEWTGGDEIAQERIDARARLVERFDAMCESQVEEADALTECKAMLQPAEA